MRTLTAIILILALTISCKQEAKQKTDVTTDKEEVTEVEEVKIEGEEVSYATDDTNMKGYIAYDENLKGKRPGIIVVHEWWGHNEYVRHRADMLAELGYTALAIDMYGDGKQAAHPDDAGKFAQNVLKNLDVASARFRKAMEVLKSHPSVDSTQIAAIGYCFGGSVVLTMANTGADLDAVAAFHSGIKLPVMPNEKLKARVLVCNGADDPFIPEEDVRAFKSKMDAVDADYKYISYEGAQHSFTSKAADSLGKKFNMPASYNKEADERSWQALKEFLADTFD